MSYKTSSSSPQAPSKRNRYDVPYERRTRNAKNNTYDHYGEEFDVYEATSSTEPTNRRQQGFT